MSKKTMIKNNKLIIQKLKYCKALQHNVSYSYHVFCRNNLSAFDPFMSILYFQEEELKLIL